MDFAYLENFLAGDTAVVVEVLELFRRHGPPWAEALQAPDGDWRALAHTIKGAARGVGANALGDACERAELGERADLAEVRAELLAVLAEVDGYLKARTPA